MDDSSSIPLKQCRTCLGYFPATSEYFHSCPEGADELRIHCKQCINAKVRAKCPRKPIPPVEGNPDEQKRCFRCLQHKPATTEYFCRDKSKKDGFATICKKCRKTPPQIEAGMKQCRKCLEIKPDAHQIFAPKSRVCRECNNAATRKHPKREPVETGYKRCCECKQIKLATRQYFPILPAGKYGLSTWCRECGNAARRKSPYRHTFAFSQRWRDYYERKKRNGGRHTQKDERLQYERQKGKCYYCGVSLGKTGYHIDHIVPIARNGSDSRDNIVATCPTCNLRKGNRLPHEWPEGNRLL